MAVAEVVTCLILLFFELTDELGNVAPRGRSQLMVKHMHAMYDGRATRIR